jgi:hypothetical protein
LTSAARSTRGGAALAPTTPQPREDLAAAVHARRAASTPPILGMKGQHLGFDEGAIFGAAQHRPLLASAERRLRPPGT